MSAPLHKVTRRRQRQVVEELLQHLRGFVPELAPGSSGPARALMEVFARYMELLHSGLADVPDRSFLSFLDMMGTQLLPAQAARAPLVFTLIDGSPADVTLPRRSQVAARALPAPPSLAKPDTDATGNGEPIVFATEQAVTLSRSRLTTLHSIVPGSDEFADHTARIASGFTLFDDLQPTEHAIYLGHDQLFALAGEISVILAFSLGNGNTEESFIPTPFPSRADGNCPPPSDCAGAEASGDATSGTTSSQSQSGVTLTWEYLTDSGWLPLEHLPEDDTTGGLRRDGQMMLRRACGPDAKNETIESRRSFWLRGRLTTPLLPLETAGRQELPVINDIRASVKFGKTDLLPEAAFNDGIILDVTKPFYPFGQRPATHAVFYAASKEVFQRKGAEVSIDLTFSSAGGPQTNTSIELVWEYSDGSQWRELIKADTEPSKFRKDGTLSFRCPDDWGETSVNGVKNYWLRARITKGDYGHPIGVTVTGTGTAAQITPTDSTLEPPIVSRLGLSYSYVTNPEPLDHCLARNDFVFADHTEACRWPDQTFTPFQLVADRSPAVHLGFDRALPAGLVSLYVDVPAAAMDGPSGPSSTFVWEYRSARGWTELSVLDETSGFERSGMVQFIGPPDAIAVVGLGGVFFRLRARLKNGERVRSLPTNGMWLNAVWAIHSRSYEQEPLGSSDGNPGQTFNARYSPVLTRERLEVQEWTGRGEYWRTFVQNVDDADLRFERDPATDDAIAVWVRWTSRQHLHDSASADRHYLIERARGLVMFGDGRHGLIPPAGNRLRLSYESGGGLAGNLPAGAIAELRTAVPYVMGSSNPAPSSGGAAIESAASVRARGPERLRHRDRALAPQDFEWMARDASPEVARARCLPITGPDGYAQRGWVTVLIVPHSEDAQPYPTVELRRRVRDHLIAHAPASVAWRVRVEVPRFVVVSVSAELVPLSASAAALVEANVRARLDRFLHPLMGGVAREGWNFGETVHLSQIASIIEGTDGVDFARDIGINVGGQLLAESIPIDADTLLASGDHELKLVAGAA